MATVRTLTPVDEIKARIETLHQDGVRAFNKGDVEKLVSFYSPDAIVMAPNRPPASGMKAIRELYREAMNMGLTNFKTEITRIVPSNELIIVAGTYTMDMKTPTELLSDNGKFVVTYQIIKNDYKVLFDIWNSDLPTPPLK